MDNKFMDNKMDNKPVNPKNQRIWVLLGVLAVIIIIIIITVAQSNKSKNNSGLNKSEKTSAVKTGTTTANVAVTNKTPGLIPVTIPTSSKLTKVQVENLKTAKVVVPGANPITKDNRVVTPQGLPTETSGRSIAPNAPKQTGFLNKATLPKDLVQISIANNVFTPNTLTTKAGAPTSFALTSTDNLVHVLNFKAAAMSAITMLVGPGQTKEITFNAPPKAGSYTFYDSTPGSSAMGTLIVK